MAHILFISPYYPPEKAAAAICVSEVAKRLVHYGHRVTVLTTIPNYPTGIVPPEYRGQLIQREVLEGVNVVRIWSYVTANKGFLLRILAHFSFGMLVPLLGAKAIGQPDILVVQSPPLFDAFAARILAWVKSCPFIFMVSDLWPESAVQLGALRNRLFIRLAEWLEWSTYQRARLVWVVTEQVRASLIRRGFPPERIFLLTYGVDISKFYPMSQAQARTELQWNDGFILLYAGTHGLAHGLITVLDTAKQLQEHIDIHFVFVGDGAEKAHLIARAQELRLKNVTFLDAQPHEKIPLLLAAADACLIPLRNIPLFQGVLPTKMYEAMACARPILLSVDGEARHIAEEEAHAAIYVEPENASSLASAILSLRENSNQAQQLGENGRAFAEARFDYNQLVAKLNERIEFLCEKKTAPLYVHERQKEKIVIGKVKVR